MKNKLALLFFALCFVQGLHAQLALHGTVANAASSGVRQLALEFWNVERWQQIETVDVEPGDRFGLTLEGVLPGHYRWRRINEARAWNDFLVPDSLPAIADLAFSLDVRTMDGRPAAVRGMKESEAYIGLVTAQRRLEQLRDSLGTKQPAAVQSAVADLNKLSRELAAAFPKTMLSDVADMFYLPAPADYAADPAAAKMTADEFTRAYGLRRVPFQRERIMFHNAFIKALNRYYNAFGKAPENSQAYIDALMTHRNGNDNVDAYLFKFLLDNMMDAKDEAGLKYLLKWYTPDCSAEENPLPGSIQNLIEALKVCTPGNLAPDLTLPGIDGKPVNLGEVASKNKVTLLLFWRSTCTHCREFEPELERIYQKYRKLGVEVYALSNDKTDADWLGFLREHPMPWINVFIPRERRPELSRQYPFASTPALIAIDRQRRVISRLIPRNTLEGYLDDVLKQQKSK
jgi:thiol-disulfide isomerase/thioredoxin